MEKINDKIYSNFYEMAEDGGPNPNDRHTWQLRILECMIIQIIRSAESVCLQLGLESCLQKDLGQFMEEGSRQYPLLTGKKQQNFFDLKIHTGQTSLIGTY